MRRLLLLISLLALPVFASNPILPPTTSKVSGDTKPITTFNYDFSAFTGTHNGTTLVLNAGAAGSGVNTVGGFSTGSIGSGNGALISGTTITFGPADATHAGMVSTGAQSFGGAKTFSTNSTSALTIGTGASSSAFKFDTTNNALGINNSSPSSSSFIDGVNSSNATKRILLTGYGIGSTIGFRGRLARGTSTAPTAAQSGDILNFMSGQGYGATQFPATSTGDINFSAAENFTDSANGTNIIFQTTPTSSTTIGEVARISAGGNLLLGTTTDSGTQKLQVNGNSNVGTVTGGIWNGQSTYYHTLINAGSTAWLSPTQFGNSTVCKLLVLGSGGAGGGNAAATNLPGAGGGAAGNCSFYSTVSPNTSYSLQVGASVAGVTAANGTSGQNSWIIIAGNDYVSFGGGGGLTGFVNPGGLQGQISTNCGPYSSLGQQGDGTAQASGTMTMGGRGGSSMMGFGGAQPAHVGSGASSGNPGIGFGSGGSGSVAGPASAAVAAGGSSAPGVIAIDCWN